MQDSLFVSRWRGLSYVLRPEKKQADARTGEFHVVQPKIKVKFEADAIPPWAVDQALEKLHVTGLAESESPRMFMGSFDVDQAVRDGRIRREDRDFVVQRMCELADAADTWIQIVRPKTPAPIPNFDELSPSRLIAVLSEGGFDLGLALAYELENQGRNEVVEKLQSAIAKRQSAQPEEELVDA